MTHEELQAEVTRLRDALTHLADEARLQHRETRAIRYENIRDGRPAEETMPVEMMQALRSLRRARKVTLAHVAQEIGATIVDVSAFERGTTMLEPEPFKRLSAFMREQE